MRITLTTIACLLIFGCTKDNNQVLEESVDQEFVVYFERFAEEAKFRDYIFDWEKELISARLISINDDAVGQCLTFNNGSNQINIDISYWNKSTDLEREFLVFHELGHCLLERSHLDQRNQDGTCTSMMNSGESLCKKNYNLETRKEYIDELFS